MPDSQAITHLLNEVKQISDRSKEIARLKGENFNIFQILKLSRNEVNLHSRLIKDLLNPKGRHQKGSIFLELFLNTVKETFNLSFLTNEDSELSNSIVENEKYIGPVDYNLETGGIIDLLIISANFVIAIENKIDAIDQDKQLIRYSNYIDSISKNKSRFLLYLTLYGKEPSEESIQGKFKDLKEKTDFKQISYKHHIISWLKKCHEKAHDEPILRETIKQYIILIQSLTGKLTSNMEEELKKTMLKNYKASKLIHDNFDTVHFEFIKEKFWDNLEKELKNLGWECEFPDINKSRFLIRKKNWHARFGILLAGNNRLGDGFIIGIKIGKQDNNEGKWDTNKISEIFPSKKKGSFFVANEQINDFNHSDFRELLENNDKKKLEELKNRVIERVEKDKRLLEKINKEAYVA